jgi:hypothetical protein
MLACCYSLRVLTLRTPSRIRPLLSEFLEVLLSVIQPLSSISGMYVNPDTFALQMQEHAAQASYLRSIFDAELIEQELKHDVFDPSSLFRSIGHTLKSHCAPMRDRAVDAMVAVAESCAPRNLGCKAVAMKTVRMCLEILELMKLVSGQGCAEDGSIITLMLLLGYCQSSVTDAATPSSADVRPL